MAWPWYDTYTRTHAHTGKPKHNTHTHTHTYKQRQSSKNFYKHKLKTPTMIYFPEIENRNSENVFENSDMEFADYSPILSLLMDDIEETTLEEQEQTPKKQMGDLLVGAEELLDMTEKEFDDMVNEIDTPVEVMACINDMMKQLEVRDIVMKELIQGKEPLTLTRSNSLLDIGLEHTEEVNAEDISFFSDEETPIISSSDSEDDSDMEQEMTERQSDVTERQSDDDEMDDEEPAPEYSEELQSAIRKIGELRTEVEELKVILVDRDIQICSLRKQLDRKREREDCDVVEISSPKRRKIESEFEGHGCVFERHGCPFCEWEANTKDIRDIRDHLTNGSCSCPTDEMVDATCSYENKWCTVGMNGYDCLVKLGFKDPDNHVESFRHFKCPKCEFRTFQASKFLRHLKKKRNGGCGFSPDEAKRIKDEQCRRKTCCSPVLCRV